MDTPVASFTSAVQVPLVTDAARAGEAKKVDGIASTEKTKKQRTPISGTLARDDEERPNMHKSYS
jgi:hypothetical protein